MDRIQEFVVALRNGDVVFGEIHEVSGGYQLHHRFVSNHIPAIEPGVSPILQTPAVAFTWLLHQSKNFADLASTLIQSVNNPNNTELLDKVDQEYALKAFGVEASVTVNGQ